jgi:hypothetical protein
MFFPTLFAYKNLLNTTLLSAREVTPTDLHFAIGNSVMETPGKHILL